MILSLLVASAIAYTAWSLICMEANVRKARALHVPVIRIPIDPMNVPWMVFQPLVWKVLDSLPFDHPDSIRLCRWGWYVHEYSNIHAKLGPAFALVSPVSFYLHVADPEAVHDLLWKRKAFLRPVKEYQILAVFGHCISTAGSEDWARHRKVLAPPFSESMMSFLWNETINQSRAMIQSWTRTSSTGVPSMQTDVRMLSLNVLASTALKKSYQFRGSADPAPPAQDEADDYRGSLQTVLENIMLLLMIPYKFLANPVMPKKWRRIGQAGASFQRFISKMLDDETQALSEGKSGSGGLLTGCAQALEVHKQEEAVGTPMKEKKGLSAAEICGNLFVTNFAGHDATFNTLSFTILLLIAHPEIQEWVAEEVVAVTGGKPAQEWDYKALYPRLKRCRAVLLETLRIYPSFPIVPKVSSSEVQTLKVGEQTLVIPPNTNISASIITLQSHPAYWTDPMSWKPERWIVNQGASADRFANEELWTPDRLIYVPWSDGPMSCLGRKAAEVELTGAVACLLARNRLAAQPEFSGESDKEIRARVGHVVKDTGFEMLLAMKNADSVRVVCREA